MLKEDVYLFLYVKIIEIRIASESLKPAPTHSQYLHKVDEMSAVHVTSFGKPVSGVGRGLVNKLHPFPPPQREMTEGAASPLLSMQNSAFKISLVYRVYSEYRNRSC